MKANSSDVKRMYEKYPYPSTQVGNNLIYDLAGIFGLVIDKKYFEGGKVLDLGCGTGHRIIGLAEQFPDCTFVGVDMSTPSLEIAKQLAAENEVENVTFLCSSIEDIPFENEFDFITSTGVFHHMEDTNSGFKKSYRALKNDGVALIWLYHIIGEYQRLVDRELVQLLARSEGDEEYFLNVDLMNKLNKSLSEWQYGSATTQHSDSNFDKLIIDTDAYLHPIVNAYAFHEIEKMFLDSGFSNAFMAGLNKAGDSKIINLSEKESLRHTLKGEDLFNNDPDIMRRFNSLPYQAKARAIELCWKPTGISCLGLKSEASRDKLTNLFRDLK